MFAYPGGSGPRGLWGFGEGDYTPTDDFREIWWDPNRISPPEQQAGRVGAAQRRRPLVTAQAARPAPPASSRRAEVADLDHAEVSGNGSTPARRRARRGARRAADAAGERPPVPRLRPARRRRRSCSSSWCCWRPSVAPGAASSSSPSDDDHDHHRRERGRRDRRARCSTRLRDRSAPTQVVHRRWCVAYTRPLLGAGSARCPRSCRGASSPRA